MAYEHVVDNLVRIRAQIAQACQKSGRRPESVTLVAVSKFHPAEAVMAAYAAGQRVFGESYVQEALDKMERLAGHELCWHHIGKLQRNKARFAVGAFSLIHTLSSYELARELNTRAGAKGIVQEVLVQVNASREPQKSGVFPEDAASLLEQTCALPHVRVGGLMCMAAYTEDPENARATFAATRRLRDQLALTFGLPLAQLSMGMSGDFEVAIEEGASLVRIGTDIFGERP